MVHFLFQQSDAAKEEERVGKKEGALRGTVLKAKKERKEGDRLEKKATGDVKQAAKLRNKAEKLRKESEEAQKKFLAEERPVEKATQLEAHDHRQYRKEEMAVAEDVTALSEHPGNKKMRERVHSLVEKAKEAKSKMEKDSSLLTSLQQEPAGTDMSGQKGYARLREKSVHLARKAEAIAEDAVSLAKKGHKMRVAANRLVDEVEDDMREPGREHNKAKAEEAKVKMEEGKLDKLEGELEDKPASKGNGGGKYSSERKQLLKEVSQEEKKSAAKKVSEASDLASEESYDALEDAALKKEKRAAKLSKRWDEGDSNSDAVSDSQLAAREKREHILKTSQSTFLAGLFGKPGKMPWDTDTDNSLGGH